MASSGKSIGNVFTTFLTCMIGLALTGSVNTEVTAVVAALGAGTAAGALAALITLFWVIIILAILVSAVYDQFQRIRG